jgi:hypothetical protein
MARDEKRGKPACGRSKVVLLVPASCATAPQAMPNSRLPAILLAVLVSVLGGVATVVAEPASDPGKAAPAGPKAPPMGEIEFFLARGEADVCGPGCNEWIAAEGKIDTGAASRLRRLLAKLWRRRPPIYLHSPGGSVAGSLELGRLIHEQKLAVSVAYTIPHGCDRDKPMEKSCEAQKHSGQALESEFDPSIAMCNSGCVYVLAGGTARTVPPWVQIGIHDVGLDPALAPARGAAAEAKRLAHARIQEYLREMGFDEALFKAAAAIPFESNKFLEREDLVRFGIDRREIGEAGWQFVDRPTPVMRKRFFVRSESDQSRYLNGFVSLDCGAGQVVRLTLVRQHSAETSGTGPRSVSVSLQGQRVDLSYLIHAPGAGFDFRTATRPASTFDTLGDNAALGLSDPAGSAGGATLNMQGFSTAYAKLRKSCDDPARLIAATSPAKPIPYLGQLPAVQNPPAAQSGFWQNPRTAPPAAKPETPRPASPAAVLPTQSATLRDDCPLQLAAEPQHVTGKVIGFVPDEEASARTRSVEADLGAKISPAYVPLSRATVEQYQQPGRWSSTTTMAAIPEHLAVKIGDMVELSSRHRDQSLPCHFIPWTIDRLVGRAE